MKLEYIVAVGSKIVKHFSSLNLFWYKKRVQVMMRSSPKDWFHGGLFVVSCVHAIQRLFCVCLNYEFKNLVLGRFATGSILCWLLVYKVLPDRYWSKHFWPSVNVDKNMFSLLPWSWGDTSLFPFSKIEARKRLVSPQLQGNNENMFLSTLKLRWY